MSYNFINRLNAELNPICHLLALLGAHHILHVSRISVNLLKPKTYFMYHQLQHSEILCSAHNAFMRFARISDQTAIISLYSINLSVFITEAENVYCAVRTGSLNQTATVSSLKG